MLGQSRTVSQAASVWTVITAVAPENDRNCDRDQLAGFRIDLTGFLSSATHRRIAPDRL